MWFALLRQTARQHGVYLPRLIWVLRQEGGKLDRRHFHFLLTGLPKHAITAATSNLLAKRWEHVGGGMARIAPYDHARDGIGYILKCLGKNETSGIFESANSSSNGELTLSDSLWAMLKARH
jgi:hypothetical protein